MVFPNLTKTRETLQGCRELYEIHCASNTSAVTTAINSGQMPSDAETFHLAIDVSQTNVDISTNSLHCFQSQLATKIFNISLACR